MNTKTEKMEKVGNMSDNHNSLIELFVERFPKGSEFSYKHNGKVYEGIVDRCFRGVHFFADGESYYSDAVVILKNGTTIYTEIDLTHDSRKKAKCCKNTANILILNFRNMTTDFIPIKRLDAFLSDAIVEGRSLAAKQVSFSLPMFQNKTFSSAFVDKIEKRIILGSEDEAAYIYTEPHYAMGKNEFFWGDFSKEPYDFKKDFFEQI